MANTIRKASKATGAEGASIAAASRVAFAVSVNRPASGALLISYTRAWMKLEGLHAGGTISMARMRAIAGQKAIDYHRSIGTIETKANGELGLTKHGQYFFSDENEKRRPGGEVVEAYQAMMTTGRPDGVLVKSSLCLTQV